MRTDDDEQTQNDSMYVKMAIESDCEHSAICQRTN